MSRFNLIDEKWIPVRFPDGNRDELGISEVLLRSREIAVIEDPSPLVVAGLHRFLLAVLYRALEGPTDIEKAKDLFRDGLPSERITAYLNEWRDRFWLFDETYPFYQVPDYEPKEEMGEKQWKAWTALSAEHNTNNSKVLFDHTDNTNAGSIPSSAAARWLIACQTFALARGKSDLGYSESAPSANALMALPLGRTLQDTLILSLVPENRDVLATDRAVWEREPETLASVKAGKERMPTGLVDLYTWTSRSIKLHLEGDGSTLARLADAAGVRCELGDVTDPMLSYRINEKFGKLPNRLAYRDRGLWRDFDSLLPDLGNLSPRVLDHARFLTRTHPARVPRAVIVLGQAADQAKIRFWRLERFTLPEGLLDDSTVRTELRELLVEADATAATIADGLRKVARLTLARGNRDLQDDKWKAGTWIPGDVSNFVGQREHEDTPRALTRYWIALESTFHLLLSEFTEARDSDSIRSQWLIAVRNAARIAWDAYESSIVRHGAWTIRAVVQAEEPIRRMMSRLDEEIVNLTPQTEGA